MCVWNQTPTVSAPSSAHKTTVAVWNQTFNGFAPMSSYEVKLLCLDPDTMCFVPSIGCNVICSIFGNTRITLGRQLTRNVSAYVSRNTHWVFMPCQLPEHYMLVWNQTINCFVPVAHSKSKLLCPEADTLCFLHPFVLHMMWFECENGLLTSASLES